MMKKIIILAVLCSMLSACESSRHVPGYGEVSCIGAFDTEDKKFMYKTSGWNVAMAIIFIELIAPPVIVIVDQMKCPYALKEQ